MIGMIEWYLTTQVIVSISNRSFANVIIWFRLVCIIKEVSTIIYQVLKLVLGNKENSSWQCMTNKIIFIAAYQWPVPYTCILRYLKKKLLPHRGTHICYSYCACSVLMVSKIFLIFEVSHWIRAKSLKPEISESKDVYNKFILLKIKHVYTCINIIYCV